MPDTRLPQLSGDFSVTRVATTAGAKLILAKNPKRKRAMLRNVSVTAAEVIYIGHDTNVTSSLGWPLEAGTAANVFGASISILHQDEVWAIPASGTPSLSVWEENEV